MCGIFAYASKNHPAGSVNAVQKVFNGLKSLDYRGYDSWGIATVLDGSILVNKEVGKVEDSGLIINGGEVAVGHTRWATHGGITQANAHPHYSSDKEFVLVHNGVVENFDVLKKDLVKKGYEFISETDTEVIVRLIEDSLPSKSLYDSVRNAFLELEGRNTIVVLNKDGDLIGARNGSPLILGFSPSEHTFVLSSDTNSLSGVVKKFSVIENGEIVYIKHNDVSISELASNEEVELNIEELSSKAIKRDKGDFPHFMLKEIYDTPEAIRSICETPHQDLLELSASIKNAGTVFTIGSGSSGVTASQIAFFLRSIGKVNAISLVGADCTEYWSLFGEKDLLIAPSQSGETADVLEVLEVAQSKGAKLASIVNMQGSMMERMSDFKFMCNAGVEACVMTTKVLTAEICWGYLLAKTLEGNYEKGKDSLLNLAKIIEDFLNNDSSYIEGVNSLANFLSKQSDIYLLGKGDNYQIMREGMVKIIEGSYIHAHALPAGDLKHYVITLMEEGVPVVASITDNNTRKDILSSLNEVKARGATTIGISATKEEVFDHWLKINDAGDLTPIVLLVTLQLLSYQMALLLGNNIDKPRNIAKSVTVK